MCRIESKYCAYYAYISTTKTAGREQKLVILSSSSSNGRKDKTSLEHQHHHHDICFKPILIPPRCFKQNFIQKINDLLIQQKRER
mmetsp:Transcript_43453/g.105324  ORF Transcript_43453/g.105324 Transcript_43453/m.105324 type:complete len:85 (-) Transcript_43453:332-586(-)